MLRLNRGRVIGLVLTTFIFYFLFFSSANSNSNSDFRRRTEEGLSRRHGVLQGDVSDEAYRAQTKQQLDDILARQAGGQRPLDRVSDEGVGPARGDSQGTGNDDGTWGKRPNINNPIPGRKKQQQQQPPPTKEKPKYPLENSEEEKRQKLQQNPGDDDGKTEKEASSARLKSMLDPGKTVARQKLQEYFKNPLVIFSKSYCPHSKRAKQLLLEVYKIVPTPLVVELNELSDPIPKPDGDDDGDDNDTDRPAPTVGQKLQELLFEISGRRTVPNIMVGTTSIGGNDLIWQMHDQGTLADKIRELAGKRITSIEIVDDAGEAAK